MPANIDNNALTISPTYNLVFDKNEETGGKNAIYTRNRVIYITSFLFKL